MAGAATSPREREMPASRSTVTPSRERSRDRLARRPRIREGHQVALAEVAETVREQSRDEVAGRIMERRRPDVRLPAQGGEDHQDLGQPPVEGCRVVGPANALEPVPERLGLGLVVEEDRIAQIAQVAARDRVDPGLVEHQPTHRGRVDDTSGYVATWRARHAGTIARPKPGHRQGRTQPRNDSDTPNKPDKEIPMSHRSVAALAVSAVLMLAACSSSGSSPAASGAPHRSAAASPPTPAPSPSTSSTSTSSRPTSPPRPARSSPSPIPAPRRTPRRSTAASAPRPRSSRARPMGCRSASPGPTSSTARSIPR